MEKLLGVAGLIELLGLQKKTLHNWLSLNEFNLKDHLSKVGRSWRIDEENLDRWVKGLPPVNREDF